ncbi:hypothetical protein [Cellulomonas phragmiteti]|uniref:Tetratricopeptide repeat protein n=1 Tax=Cellulomonas phragmiteti TaxID=478780 RepID=A0ABQ4DSE6_9CELL|nr:hypothetical protein [Cellulomonas phragmiteti]GIG41917.1 hypothetical protein Cph01nite_36790 [Cellulomonas phragmiteti]
MEDLDARLARLLSGGAVGELVDLGCDLAEAGRDADAERCFRVAADLSDAVAAFNLGNTLVALERPDEAVVAYRCAVERGETAAWLNLGHVLQQQDDVAGAMWAYACGGEAGDLGAQIALAFMLREQHAFDVALIEAERAAAAGDAFAGAVVACWRWCTTLDVTLEPQLRAGAEHFPAARSDLAHLLAATGRLNEARRVLERGAKLGESDSLLPLGNLYRDEFDDASAAETAYRAGVAAGDLHCHVNLGQLLEDRGELREAEEQYRLGVTGGDALALRALHDLLAED